MGIDQKSRDYFLAESDQINVVKERANATKAAHTTVWRKRDPTTTATAHTAAVAITRIGTLMGCRASQRNKSPCKIGRAHV